MLLVALRTDVYGRVKVDERILWGGLAVGMGLFLSGGLTALHFCSKTMRDGGKTIDTFVKHKTLRFVMRGGGGRGLGSMLRVRVKATNFITLLLARSDTGSKTVSCGIGGQLLIWDGVIRRILHELPLSTITH